MTREEALAKGVEVVRELGIGYGMDVGNITTRIDESLRIADWLLDEPVELITEVAAVSAERKLIGYRDCEGDLWTQREDGKYVFDGCVARTPEELARDFGPLEEVYE